jgi:glycosyltransferase involved in cell wall biosynthesis
MPKVSVILPTYNCAEYLSDSVPSVLSQTFQDFELIVVDNGSTDGTEDFIRTRFTDPRIVYVKQAHSGLSAARNKGIEVSSGDYIAFLDADDLFLSRKLERQVSFFETHPGAGITYTREKYFFENDRDKQFESPHEKLSGDILFFLKRSNFIHVSTVMLKSGIAQRASFDPDLKSHEDWDFFLKLSAAGNRFYYIPEELTQIRVRKKSMTARDAVMDSSRRVVGERARIMWKGIGKGLRYFSLRARAALLRFPNHPRFNRPSLFKDIPDAPRLIFGSSVHEDFGSFLDLYKGVQRFFNKPLYLYASNEHIGRPVANLVKIESRRNYKWRRSHNFIFDAIGQLDKYDYEYFVALDSDCLVCGDRLLDFAKEEDFDFIVYPNLNGLGGWYHGNVFRENINLYLGILRDIGNDRKDENVVGNFNPLIILSKRSVDFLRDLIPKIESSPSYKEIMKLDFSVGETLIFNILKDANFKPRDIELNLKRGLRYRPYWEAREFKKDISIYHPVRRKWSDPFRRLAGIKAGYDINHLYMIPIYAYKFIEETKNRIFPAKDKHSDEGTTWFNP